MEWGSKAIRLALDNDIFRFANVCSCLSVRVRTHVCRNNENVCKAFSKRNEIENDYKFSLDTEPSSVHVMTCIL